MPDAAVQEPFNSIFMAIFTIMSVAVLAASFNSARHGRILGPTKGRLINWVTFAIGVFVAAFFFNFGLLLARGDYVLDAFFYSIQMIDMGRDIVDLPPDSFPLVVFHLVRCYEILLYCLAPISFIGVIASYLVRFISLPYACISSWTKDSYILSELNESTIALAKSIYEHARQESPDGKPQVNIIFTSVHRDLHDKLQIQASEAKAICVRRSVESLWRNLSKENSLHIVLASENEAENITRAADLRYAIQQEPETSRPRSVFIYSIASLYGAESLLAIGEGSDQVAAKKDNKSDESDKSNEEVKVSDSKAPDDKSKVTNDEPKPADDEIKADKDDKPKDDKDDKPHLYALRIDWTRILVESTLDEYPLFLLGSKPADPPTTYEKKAERYRKWQYDMYENTQRHVVIIGAGHVGLEFLRLSLSTSRFCAPPGDKALSFRFDVFDSVPYVINKSQSRAQKYFEAQMPGLDAGDLESKFNCHFHFTDVLGPEFERELVECCKDSGGITYAFIALGDDLMAAQTAMRVRESIERMRVRRYAAKGGKKEYQSSSKPLVLAVVDDIELAHALEHATDDGFNYDIKTVGTPDDMYTYQRVFGSIKEEDLTKTEYKRRSSRASNLHLKYKIYAFLRSNLKEAVIFRSKLVDWTSSSHGKGLALGMLTNYEVLYAYKKYVRTTKELASISTHNHEWLLRMEHERWNAYIWAEGFVRATTEEVAVYFDTCQFDKQRHRFNGANMHPCLVSFDELKEIDGPIDALYQVNGISHMKTIPFQLYDDDYLGQK